MTKQEFHEFLNSKIVILDGATGSNLQKKGMTSGVCPEKWILENPEALIELQLDFLKSGTDILYAPTFTANRPKLKEYGLQDRIKEYNHSLVSLSKEAVKRYREEANADSERNLYVAGDLTMTGEQLYPLGTLEFEELVNIYKEQIQYLVEAGVDLLVIETMMRLQECRAAIIAAKETCDLPIMVTMTFNEDGRTLFGTDPETAVVVLQSLSVDAVGVNCSTGPEKMCEIIAEMKRYANIPLIAKPNAGLPKLVNGETVFDMGPEEFATKAEVLLETGATVIGGCCGSTPKHIEFLAKKVKEYTINKEEIKTSAFDKETDLYNNTSLIIESMSNFLDNKEVLYKNKGVRALTTERKTVPIDIDGKFFIVGERINPTGKKDLQAELREGCFDIVTRMAEEQEVLGADILDINMGMNGIDEKEMMLKAIDEVMLASDLPLCIDSSHVEVMEAALRNYPGRALINSISLEKEKFEKLIPIAKKYGAMFILLPLSETGLPKDIEEKKQIIRTILDAAIEHGLTKEDIIVDGLVNTVGANKRAAIETLETIRYCKEDLGLATIVGLSNISFGLPERQFINSTFLAMAIQNGLTMAIANPSQDLLMNTAFASDLLMNREEADLRYINRVTSRPQILVPAKGQQGINGVNDSSNQGKVSDHLETNTASNQSSNQTNGESNNQKSDQTSNQEKNQASEIFTAVLKGNRKKILDYVKPAVESGTKASDILDKMLIPAISEVGKLFDQQKYFLPQLIASAEAMKVAIEYLEPMLKSDADTKKKGTIVIATVSGDVHDIGKNLVALMLKNYGFEVIDLGKDVASELIIQTAKEKDADIIALSALMTTTMKEMKEVIRMRNEAGLRTKVIIGGAVITQSYCDEILADGFSKDAQEAVLLVKRLLDIQ